MVEFSHGLPRFLTFGEENDSWSSFRRKQFDESAGIVKVVMRDDLFEARCGEGHLRDGIGEKAENSFDDCETFEIHLNGGQYGGGCRSA